MQLVFVQSLAVIPAAVLAQLLSVIGGYDQHGILKDALRAQTFDKVLEPTIDSVNSGGVAGPPARVGRQNAEIAPPMRPPFTACPA
jgi:hypothetical protein